MIDGEMQPFDLTLDKFLDTPPNGIRRPKSSLRATTAG